MTKLNWCVILSKVNEVKAMEKLKREEKIIFDLRKIYEQFGYKHYKMKKFEEYDRQRAERDATYAAEAAERERSEVLSPSKYSDIFVVKSVSFGIGKNDEEVAKVCGYIAGKEETHDLTPEIASGIKPGDIIQLGGKVNSVVSAINKVFYCDTRQMGETYDGTKLQNPTSTILYSDNRFVYGTVYYSDKSAFTLMVNDVPELSYLTGLFKIVLVDTTGRDVEVTPGHASGILAELDYPSQGSKVFVHTSAITPKTIVIYR